MRKLALVFIFFICCKLSFGQYYVRGDHNSWGTSNQLTQRTSLGGGDTYSTLFQASFDQQFKIANGDYSHQWGDGYWITTYDQKWDIGANGNNAIWKGSPSTYIQVNSYDPASFVNQNIQTGIMTLSSVPVDITFVTQIGTFNGSTYQTSSTSSQNITITLSAPKSTQEKIYLRYTTNNWMVTNWVEATGSGTNYSAVIPGQSIGTTVSYYVMTSTMAWANNNDLDSHPNLMTLKFNNNGGSNYSYIISAPLPVQIKDFDVNVKNKGHNLKWTTASETNNEGFDIERSADGSVWKSIGFVKGQGNSSHETEYSWTDTDPLQATSYYRLRQVDFDGKFSYSETRSVSQQEKATFSVRPNPFTSHISLDNLSEARVEVVDLAGRTVFIAASANNNLSIDLEKLTQGMYLLRVTEGSKVFTVPVFRQ